MEEVGALVRKCASPYFNCAKLHSSGAFLKMFWLALSGFLLCLLQHRSDLMFSCLSFLILLREQCDFDTRGSLSA